MLNYPPIDKLMSMTKCKYELSCVIAKRARQILTQESELMISTNKKPVSIAAEEFYEGKITIQQGS